jgi:hypothetical protein
MQENTTYDKKTCAHCGVNGIVKKVKLIFKYNKSAKCCYYCIEKLGGIENTKIWLEKHVRFNNNAQYWFE